jgi:uncharacterized membrane protein YuzA (DUF378 family)
MGMFETKDMNVLDWLFLVMLVIGGLNWGFIGFFNYNLIEALFSNINLPPDIVYDLVGISAIYAIWLTSSTQSSD